MSTFDCLYSSNPCLMDLGCPLLRGSSDRRLRRGAATDSDCYKNTKTKFSVHRWRNFSPSLMATLRNKTKLAAVARETPEGTRSSRAQNVLDPELTQDYISQVSEEIEGRVIKKLSKEISKTESRILGALSKLDEFLLKPQVRICSVAVPGTSRNNTSENRETTGDRSSDDPCPEARYFSHHSGHFNSLEAENYPHICRSWSLFAAIL